MENTLFLLVEEVFCWLFLLWGLSMVVQTQLWIRLVKYMNSQSEDTLKIVYLATGALLLPVTLAAVLIHNDWSLSPFIIVTIVFWLTLIKAILLILWPQLLLKCQCIYNKSESSLNWYFKGFGIVYIILSLVVCLSEWSIQ